MTNLFLVTFEWDDPETSVTKVIGVFDDLHTAVKVIDNKYEEHVKKIQSRNPNAKFDFTWQKDNKGNDCFAKTTEYTFEGYVITSITINKEIE